MPVKRLSIRQARPLKVLFKRRWILAKLLMTIGGVLFGMLFLEQHMLDASPSSRIPLRRTRSSQHTVARSGSACSVSSRCSSRSSAWPSSSREKSSS